MKLWIAGGLALALLLGALLWVSQSLGAARAELKEQKEAIAQIAADAKLAAELGGKLDRLRLGRVEKTNELIRTLEKVPFTDTCVNTPAYDVFAGMRLAEPVGPTE